MQRLRQGDRISSLIQPTFDRRSSVMQAVGLNRFFGDVLTNEALDYRMLPTLTFIVSVLIAFATGTSWGVSNVNLSMLHR